jgi:hypothetical protein
MHALTLKTHSAYPSLHPDPEWRLTSAAFNHWDGTLHDDDGSEIADLTYIAGQDFERAWQYALQFCGSRHAVAAMAAEDGSDVARLLERAQADYDDAIAASKEV